MIFQQNMPTKEWREEDLSTIIAEAYVYQSYFIKWIYFRYFYTKNYSKFYVDIKYIKVNCIKLY